MIFDLPTDLLITALTTLIVAVDPPGLAPIFAGLVQGIKTRERRIIAVTASVLAFLILTMSALFGASFLAALGVSLPAFRIAGGLLLFYTAFEMVFEKRDDRKRGTADRVIEHDAVANRNLAAFPLAIPLMAGPGAITACILLAARMEGSAAGLGALVAIIAAVCLMCLASFLAADLISRLLGELGRTVLSRLLGVVLAALAVQFVADGVRGLVLAG